MSFSERRRLLAEQRGKPIEAHSPPKVEFDEDLIPTFDYDKSEDDYALDSAIESIQILDAYRRWIGKEVDEKTTKQKEGVKVSCPEPTHRDAHPSAWLNTENKTWFCGGCQEGGDLFDLAAIHFGFDRPGYKEGSNFPELRKAMAESFGFKVKVVAGTEMVWKEQEEESTPTPEPAPKSNVVSLVPKPKSEPEPLDEETSSNVVKMREELYEAAIVYPSLNWRKIVPEGTFLWEYLAATSHDDSPEEYHFFHGLLALGHAGGRNVYLDDTRPVFGNMLLCLLGGTGFGKTRSRAWVDDVIEAVLPYHDTGLGATGTKLVSTPGSGENLIRSFEYTFIDPTMPKGPGVRSSVNGIVDFDEFAGLLARANRQGSTLKTIVMQFADSKNYISNASNTGGEFVAYKPFCSITASTQPRAVRTLLSRFDVGSGFLNRWLFVAGARKQREVMGGSHTSIHVDLSAAIEELKKIRGWAGIERQVTFDDISLPIFEDFMSNTVFPAQYDDESDLLTRLDLSMKRIALLFCVNERKTTVTPEMVERLRPIFEYLVKCYGILNDEIGQTQMSEIVNVILDQIVRYEEKHNKGPSARDLIMNLKRKFAPDLIRRALETMVALDMIDADKPRGPGRPTLRYKAVK